jgi:hypothetical protein
VLSIGNLALKPAYEPPRRLITPGQLYRLLSAEFRAHRPARCACRAPMVAAREPASGGANWQLEPRLRTCGACDALVASLARRYAQDYDLLIAC